MTAKLSPIERNILSKLTVKELQFFSKIAHDKDFATFIKITETLVDYEKNDVFKMNDADPDLGTKKAYARGRAGGYTQMGRLIMASAKGKKAAKEYAKKLKKGGK